MTVLTNAALVLEDRISAGAIRVEDGLIVELAATGPGEDMQGDYLIPGIIDLHTDNLERQILPRSNARWPSRSALLAHDGQCAAAGITTVFDALCLGDVGFEKTRNQTFEDGFRDLRALTGAGVLKAEHFLHLRCELPAPEMPEMLGRAIDDELVRLVSIMDHSPGLGQYADIARYRQMRASEGFAAAEIDETLGALQENHLRHHGPNRAFVLAAVQARGIPLASHDDRLGAEIARNHAEGIAIAEFPVSREAAQAARDLNMRIIAGAPNIVRGGSHSGNVAVLELLRDGLLDALASDYVPAAMLEAAWRAVALGAASLPAAIALLTAGPAAIAGLHDRGRLAPGLRADLVQMRVYDGLPVVRAVWRQGVRIA